MVYFFIMSNAGFISSTACLRFCVFRAPQALKIEHLTPEGVIYGRSGLDGKRCFLGEVTVNERFMVGELGCDIRLSGDVGFMGVLGESLVKTVTCNLRNRLFG